MTPAEILARAAQIIEERGWRQGELGDPDIGPRCVLGAVNNVRCGTPRYAKAIGLIQEQIGTNRIAEWNDDPSRTLPQVLAMLRGEDWRKA